MGALEVNYVRGLPFVISNLSPTSILSLICVSPRSSNDPTLKSLSSSLSTRQLLRTARQMASFDASGASSTAAPPDVWSAVERACLARFLPALAKNALEESMEKAGIEKKKSGGNSSANSAEDLEGMTCRVDNGALTIGWSK